MATKPLSLDDLKSEVEAAPDVHDGVDLTQHKRQAVAMIDQLRNQMTIIRKLSK